MGTNGKTAGVAGVEVLVAGQPLDPTLAPLLQEVRVEDNLTLPDAFLLRISDPGLKHIDSHPLEVGSEIEIRIGGPDAKLLTTPASSSATSRPPARNQPNRLVMPPLPRPQRTPGGARPHATGAARTPDRAGPARP